MARERMVTRTIVNTVYTVMAVQLSTREVVNTDVTVPSATSMKDKEIEAYIRQALQEDGLAFATVLDKQNVETLYGMSEALFIQFAKVLPPRKAVDTEETEE